MNHRIIPYLGITVLAAVTLPGCGKKPAIPESKEPTPVEPFTTCSPTREYTAEQAPFTQAAAGNWKVVFADPGTGDWTKQWFLDGEVGTVTNSPEGMTLTAGPEFKNDAHHMVLWTKNSFEGDLKIEYDYTRLDQATSCVNILYIQATGMGKAPYVADITQWNALRKVPSMNMYHDFMNTYHISFAAFEGEDRDYVRARRYMPKGDEVEKGVGRGLRDTDLEPDYFNTGMFAPGRLHHFTIIKRGRELFMRVTNKETTRHFHWRNTKAPAIESGRIGLRHMFTRSARYANFRVSMPSAASGMAVGKLHPEISKHPAESVAREAGQTPDKTGVDRLVSQTHAASLKLREAALRKTIAQDICWPDGVWGDNLWCLSALYLNEKADAANARLLKQAEDYLAAKPAKAAATTPEAPGDLPWTFFSVTDYVRTLCLFHAQSRHFPGRLEPETEAAMKEALWRWVSGESRLADAGTDDLFLLLGTENHDLNRRPAYYLITSLLGDDPSYRGRKLADGHTTAEHAEAYTKYFREWPASRARTGLWVEVGSNTYQKYSWPALFNLHELAPDPVIRKRFGLLLDLAFIEEEQISVNGRRGGGRSRAYPGDNPFDSYKNLLYAAEGRPAGCSHSRVIETSRYQLPPEATLLRYRVFPPPEPFVIRNRVLGELEAAKPESETGERLAADSTLVNYAWRTPHYLLGSTLQNPSLDYSGISRQNRACGMLFDDPADKEICSVHSVIPHNGGGRPQHSFWSVQHENVLILQRIAPAGRSSLGSYNTGAVGIGFEGKALNKAEEAGWIFASNGKAFVGVKFLDGGYVWDEKRVLATPANFNKATDTSRILLHAGDIASHGSFEKFKTDVLASRLNLTPDKVDYQFGGGKNHIEMNTYHAKTPEKIVLPRINGTPADLRPETVYDSPYLKGKSGSDKITVSVGPITRVLDFSAP